MTAQSYSLTYNGYWREPNINGIPCRSGVYSVYTCQYSATQSTVDIKSLIYIGESKNVGARIQQHEKWPEWRRYLKAGQQLCINFAPILADRERVEAALINYHKPPANTEYVNTFPYPTTTVQTSGLNSKLSSNFTVYPVQRRAAFL